MANKREDGVPVQIDRRRRYENGVPVAVDTTVAEESKPRAKSGQKAASKKEQ